MKEIVSIGDVLRLSSNLKDRKFEEWSFPKPVKARVEEVFASIGATWGDMEVFLARCYRVGINPLPQLRKMSVNNRTLDDICQVVFQKAGDKSPYLHRDALVCIWDKEMGAVTIEAVDYEEYEEGVAHQRQLDRVTTIIKEVAREREAQRQETLTEYRGQAPKPKEMVF